MPLFGSLMAASKSPDKVLSGETAAQGDLYNPGKFSFSSSAVSSSASTGSVLFMGGNAASPSGVQATQSSSVPNAFTGFGAKPPVPGSSLSVTTAVNQMGGGSIFSFSKPVFGATTTTASSETASGASPFSSFTGFGSSSVPAFGGLAAKSDKTTSVRQLLIIKECQFGENVFNIFLKVTFKI